MTIAFIETPIFLIGSERSGTTLLRLMLDHHPKIAFNLESEYMVSQISNDGIYPDIQRYHEWLKKDRVFHHSQFEIDGTLDFGQLVNYFLSQKKTRDNKEIVGATVHKHFRKLPLIWPRAKYIYLFRDGRDVANSVMHMGWAGNVYVAADKWLEAEQEWDALRPMLNEADWIEVRYEDLVANTRFQLERVCALLHVEYSARMLGYPLNTSYKSPDVTLNYQWKTKMCRSDIQLLEAKLADQLLRRGYELSGHPGISLSPLTIKYLLLQSRIRAFLFRLRRFGILLSLQEIISRRSGLTKVHERAIRRIHRITDSYLK